MGGVFPFFKQTKQETKFCMCPPLSIQNKKPYLKKRWNNQIKRWLTSPIPFDINPLSPRKAQTRSKLHGVMAWRQLGTKS